MVNDPKTLVDALIHEETQVHDGGIDLTVDTVETIDEPAHIDFGGSELQLPGTTLLDPEKRHPEDDYGWWSLEPGTYLLSFNETIRDPPIFIQPREVLMVSGAIHPTGWVYELDQITLTVAATGLELKENARTTTVWPIRPA